MEKSFGYPGRRVTFTEDQIAAAAKMVEEGYSHRQAAASIGISVPQLRVRLADLRGAPYPSSSQNNRTLKRHGITREEFDELFAKQAGKCAICESTTHRLVIDHSNSTNKVRGLLCGPCNAALGWIEKLITTEHGWFDRALDYIADRGLDGPVGESVGPGRPQTYTEEQIRRALALRSAGKSWLSAAKAIGISITRLQARARQLCRTTN